LVEFSLLKSVRFFVLLELGQGRRRSWGGWRRRREVPAVATRVRIGFPVTQGRLRAAPVRQLVTQDLRVAPFLLRLYMRRDKKNKTDTVSGRGSYLGLGIDKENLRELLRFSSAKP